MAEMMTTDVRALLDRTPFDHSAVADLREVLGRDPSRYRTLRDAVAAMRDREKGSPKPETYLRLGVGEVMLGRYNSGLEHLSKAGDMGLAHFFRGIALEHLQRWKDAIEAFAPASKAGYDTKLSDLHRAGSLRRAGKVEEARKILDWAGEARRQLRRVPLPARQPARRRRRAPGRRRRVREDAEPRPRPHRRPVRAGLHQRPLRQRRDRRRLLQAMHRAPAGPARGPDQPGRALRGRDAVPRGRVVLPPGARLRPEPPPRPPLLPRLPRQQGHVLRRGGRASAITVLKQLLEIPVTDFELSVRSRNCLRKMNIRTLGDLTRTTEAALLASKNFGETSLSGNQGDDDLEGPPAGHGPRRGRARRQPTSAPSRSRSCRRKRRRCWPSRSAT